MTPLIERYSEGRPALVFCMTQKATLRAAEKYRDDNKFPENAELRQCSLSVKNRQIATLLPFGIAFHHAGVDNNDRTTIEQLFSQNKLRVLFATSTLAVGVNLPARLVVVKST